MRALPSTMVVSFASAWTLSRLRALSSTAWVFALRAASSWSPICVISSSMSRWEYHTARLPWVAKDRMASRYPATAPITMLRLFFVGEPVAARGDGEAGREALDVPLEGAGVRLVEVVDVEHEATFGGGEHAEVADVGVPAQLHLET